MHFNLFNLKYWIEITRQKKTRPIQSQNSVDVNSAFKWLTAEGLLIVFVRMC